MSDGYQLSLFDVAEVYESVGASISNDELYRRLSNKCGISQSAFDEKECVGKANQPVSKLKRRIRWWQQTLRSQGVLERTNERGVWKYAGKKRELQENTGKVSLIAFSTKLGVAIWGTAELALKNLDEPINLVITSPPYPIRVSRNYDNPKEHEYVDFICTALEPIVRNLSASGSICINLGNEIFLNKSPARSLYKERLTLALHDRLNLHLMDRLVWSNVCKPPGPVQWASITRQQLNAGYESILWFSPSPRDCKANNRRVLEPHSQKHAEYLLSGKRDEASYSDGAYRRRMTSFPVTEGRIPRNVLTFPHNCASQSAYKSDAKDLGIPAHGAPFPLSLVTFLTKFLSEEGDLLVDPFAGSCTTGLAAELNNRRWICVDKILQYLIGSSVRFKGCPGLAVNRLSLT